MWMSLWQHRPHKEGASSLQHHTKELWILCTAWHSSSPTAQGLKCPGQGWHGGHGCSWRHPTVPSHPTALEPRGKRQVTTFLRGSTEKEGTGRETVCCQIPASDLRNFQTTSSIMDAREAGAVRAAAGPGPPTRTHTKRGPLSPWQPALIHARIFKISFIKPHMNRILSR